MKQGKFFILLLLVFSLPIFLHASGLGTPDKMGDSPELSCPLAPPTAVTVSNITSTSAQVSWTPVPGATWYRIRVENAFNPTFTNIQITNSTTVSFTTLSPNTNYVAYVSATSCGKGDDYGLEQQRPFATPAIVIEDIVYLEPCREEFNEVGVHYPPQDPNVVDLPLNDAPGAPANYDTYLVTKGNASYSFAVWLKLEGNAYKPYFKEFTAEGIERTPPSVVPPANITTSAIGLRLSNSASDFCTIRALASSALENPKMTFSFVQDGGDLAQLFSCKPKGGKSGGNAGSDIETEQSKATKLTATPNPLTDQTTLHYTVGKDSPVTLSLYNSTGTLVKTVLNKVWTEAGNQETMVEMSDLPNGLYFVTLETNEGRQVSTLVKTN
jgi:hypothetical protein